MSTFTIRRLAAVAAGAVLASSATLGTASATSVAADRPAFGHGHRPGAQDPTTFTIAEATKALKTGRITSVELTRAYLDRIAQYEPYYNAFTRLNPDALAEAAAADEARQGSQKDVGPLEGVPIVIKDSLDVRGLPTTSGWALTSPEAGGLALVPRDDAPVVERLREAGAVIVGKTNLPVLAGSGSNANNSAYGPTFNALDQDWAPGGSSSGSATAVAGDFAVTGIAEETGGSIQNPASAQSLFAVKPTFGLVPNTGNMPLAGNTRDVLGPLAKTPEDAAIMLDVLAGTHADDPKTAGAEVPAGGYTSQLSERALEGARIGLYGPGWRSGKDGELSDETAALYAEAVDNLQEQGATVVEDPFEGTGFADLAKVGEGGYDGRGSVGNAHAVEDYLAGLGDGAAVSSLEQLDDWADAHGFADDERIDEMVEALDTEPATDAEFEAVSEQYQELFDQVMDTHDLDALVFPQQVEEIPGIYDGEINASTVSEINIAQLPGVVLPDGAYDSGKPFNLIVLGEKYSEADLLGYAYDYDEAYDGRVVNRNLAATPGPVQPDEQ
ncbi:amidase [Krasilnikoviella flava]|uniref:Aspartyl-tRNA(Asn)/glutamyl-tRNA(Gln) amidotransferase subunit A n=1 Tax=Krasilnikoviella flava TaxID=526729 RepID=A0A1T5LZA2_9MICO|nr:amidase [Krasilnikoviella flava]SKC81336.1 aspartyl-tRNA(Asn)/glutamyl-tRNA(Gln) amidotransferase subunit A [Krasilnikoviella flava]